MSAHLLCIASWLYSFSVLSGTLQDNLADPHMQVGQAGPGSVLQVQVETLAFACLPTE